MEHINASLQRSLVAKDVLSSLRKEIITKKRKPDEHLKEVDISKRFGVSRGPVQAALQQLEWEGLVRVEKNGRTFVVGISDRDLEDMYDLRLYLEKQAVKIVLTQDFVDFAPIIHALNVLREELDKGEFADSVRMANLGFSIHQALMLCTGNRAIYNAWKSISSVMYTIMEINGEYVSAPETFDSHHQLVNAILQKRPDAISVIETHLLQNSKKVYKDALLKIEQMGV